MAVAEPDPVRRARCAIIGRKMHRPVPWLIGEFRFNLKQAIR